MARPKKNNADYFTHDADMRNDVKIKALRRKFSHTGYAVWNYLLETLTDSDFFEVEWEEINVELLAADYDVSVDELTEIVNYCVKIGLLQRAGGKLFSQAHQRRFASLLADRERKRISEGQNAGTPDKAGVMASQNPAETDETDDNGDPEQHSKGKESKGEETKGEIKYPYQDIADRWNSICTSLPKVSKLSDARRAKIKARLLEFGKPESWMPTVEALFEAVESSSFLRGDNKQNWQATFDWIFSNGTNWVKVMEGNYTDKGRQHNSGSATLGCDERIENGRRTYGSGKVTIPMNAPPRPGDKYAWDSSTQKWILL